MARKKKKTATAPVADEIKLPPDAAGGWKKWFPVAITALFFILSLIGILHHEMWRDEYQAWMVAADAHSLPGLFQNLKYEGHPFLWHLFLFILSSVTKDPLAMQVFHILISTLLIYLINRHSPFSVLQNVLLTFGYFTFFEYNLISRGYGLAMLLIILFCVLYPRRQKYIYWMGVITFLLANSSIFGVILGTAGAGIIFFEQFQKGWQKKPLSISKKGLAGFAGIFLTGLILGYLQIKPEPDNSFPTLYVTDYDPVRLKWALSRMVEAYLPVPDFTEYHFWNTNLFVPDVPHFFIGISIGLFLLCLIAFLRNRFALMMYLAGTLVLMVFYYYTGFLFARYAGQLFVVLIAVMWIGQVNPPTHYRFAWLNTIGDLGKKIRGPMFSVFLLAGVVGGVMSYLRDLEQPFSTSNEAAAYILDHQLDTCLIIGTRDFVISPLASQLDQQIFYPERNEPGSFIEYDSLRTDIGNIKEVIPIIQRFHRHGEKRMLLAKDLPISMVYSDGEKVLWEDAQLTDSLNLKLLTTIEPGIVEDEVYYLYEIEENIVK